MATAGAEIYRDGFGVPHVVGRRPVDAYFGLGVAAVEDRGRRLLLHQAFLDGELERWVGNLRLPDPEVSFLDALGRWQGLDLDGQVFRVTDVASADQWARRARYQRLGADGVAQLDRRTTELVAAYADGVNWALRRAGGTGAAYRPETELAWWAWFEHVIAVTLFHNSNAFACRAASGALLASDPHYWLGEGHGEAHVMDRSGELNLMGWWDGHINLGFFGGSTACVAMGITASGVEAASIERVPLDEASGEAVLHVDEKRGLGLAVTSALLADIGENLSQQLGIWRARSVQEYLEIARACAYLRGHRVIIDRLGHIGYISNGPIAARRRDWPVVFADPTGGFISSANDPPCVATVPNVLAESTALAVFGAGWNRLGPRGALQRRALCADRAGDSDSATALAFDIYVPRAHLGVEAVRRAAAPPRGDQDADAAQLDAILESWDGRAARDSVGMTVAAGLHALLPGGLPRLDITVSDRPERRPELAVVCPSPDAVAGYWPTLRRLAVLMRRRYGQLGQPWGDVHVVEVNRSLVPAAGGTRALESLFGSGPSWVAQDDCFDPDGLIRGTFGSRTVRVTEARGGRLTVSSVSVSGQGPVAATWSSAHDQAQAALYSDQRLKPLPGTLEAVRRSSTAADHVGCDHPAHEIVGTPNRVQG